MAAKHETNNDPFDDETDSLEEDGGRSGVIKILFFLIEP
jgi:hypothetical protein